MSNNGKGYGLNSPWSGSKRRKQEKANEIKVNQVESRVWPPAYSNMVNWSREEDRCRQEDDDDDEKDFILFIRPRILEPE